MRDTGNNLIYAEIISVLLNKQTPRVAIIQHCDKIREGEKR